MMITNILAPTILICMPAYALAAGIFGTITTDAGKPIQNESVRVTVDGGSAIETITDSRGTYHVFAPRSGAATLTVKSASIRVFSSERDVRYDLILVPGPKPQLRRR